METEAKRNCEHGLHWEDEVVEDISPMRNRVLSYRSRDGSSRWRVIPSDKAILYRKKGSDAYTIIVPIDNAEMENPTYSLRTSVEVGDTLRWFESKKYGTICAVKLSQEEERKVK